MIVNGLSLQLTCLSLVLFQYNIILRVNKSQISSMWNKQGLSCCAANLQVFTRAPFCCGISPNVDQSPFSELSE